MFLLLFFFPILSCLSLPFYAFHNSFFSCSAFSPCLLLFLLHLFLFISFLILLLLLFLFFSYFLSSRHLSLHLLSFLQLTLSLFIFVLSFSTQSNFFQFFFLFFFSYSVSPTSVVPLVPLSLSHLLLSLPVFFVLCFRCPSPSCFVLPFLSTSPFPPPTLFFFPFLHCTSSQSSSFHVCIHFFLFPLVCLFSFIRLCTS